MKKFMHSMSSIQEFMEMTRSKRNENPNSPRRRIMTVLLSDMGRDRESLASGKFHRHGEEG